MTAVSRTVRKTRKRVRTCGEEEPGGSEQDRQEDQEASEDLGGGARKSEGSSEEPTAIAATNLPKMCPMKVPVIMDAHIQQHFSAIDA